jgi:Sulfotransferase domain
MDPDTFFFKKASNFRDHGFKGYEAYFHHCEGSSPRVVLEATPTYLYQRTAPEVLPQLDPTPDVIFVFRKPSERAYSHFRYFKDTKARIAQGVSFREFVTLALREDPQLTKMTTEGASRIIANSRYADYIPLWLERLPQDRLHFFLFEDMARDQRSFVKVIAERIGLAPEFFDTYEFVRWNESFRIKYPRVHGIRRELGRHLPAGVRKRLKMRTASTYARLNVESGLSKRTQDELDVIAELDQYFEPLDERLAELISIDLSPWHERASETPAKSDASPA